MSGPSIRRRTPVEAAQYIVDQVAILNTSLVDQVQQLTTELEQAKALVADAIDINGQVQAERDDGYRRGAIAALREMADDIDKGPTFPLPPSVISALVREKADALAASLVEGDGDGR